MMMFLILLIVVAASALVVGMIARSDARAIICEVVRNTSVLVCALNREALDDLERDASVYSTFYRRVNVSKPLRSGDLVNAIREGGYDIVHLFCAVDSGGYLVDADGRRLDSLALLEACLMADVKLLVMASDNHVDDYVKAFQKSKEPAGLRMNLIITLARHGEKFPRFLRSLLRQVANAKSLPQAWVELAPQTHRGTHGELPETMLFADRGGVELLP